MDRSINNIWLVSFFIALAAVSRLLPHPANVTAVGAIALFGGAYFGNRMISFIVPLAAMLLSDVVMEILFRVGLSAEKGFHASMPFVYLSFAVSVLIGIWIGKKPGVVRIATGGLFSSTIFFLVTNFAVWLEGYYGFTLQGLVSCYVAAIPFHRNTLMGDAIYIAAMFGAYEFIKTKLPELAFGSN